MDPEENPYVKWVGEGQTFFAPPGTDPMDKNAWQPLGFVMDDGWEPTPPGDEDIKQKIHDEVQRLAAEHAARDKSRHYDNLFADDGRYHQDGQYRDFQPGGHLHDPTEPKPKPWAKQNGKGTGEWERMRQQGEAARKRKLREDFLKSKEKVNTPPKTGRYSNVGNDGNTGFYRQQDSWDRLRRDYENFFYPEPKPAPPVEEEVDYITVPVEADADEVYTLLPFDAIHTPMEVITSCPRCGAELLERGRVDGGRHVEELKMAIWEDGSHVCR